MENTIDQSQIKEQGLAGPLAKKGLFHYECWSAPYCVGSAFLKLANVRRDKFTVIGYADPLEPFTKSRYE